MIFSFSVQEKGSTLIELMVGMSIFLALAAAGVAFLGLQTRWSAHQEKIREAQGQVQMALEMMQRETSLAGLGLPASIPALTLAEPQEISFWANLDREKTMLTASVFPGETGVHVEGSTFLQGRDFIKGDVVWLCGAAVCEQHTLMRNGGATRLEFNEGVGNFHGTGSSVEVVHHIRYRMKEVSAQKFKLIRGVDGGGGPLAENLKSLKFSYRDGDGDETNQLGKIRRVGMQVEVSVPGRPGVERVLSGESTLRNR